MGKKRGDFTRKNSYNTSFYYSTLARQGLRLARTGTRTGTLPEPMKEIKRAARDAAQTGHKRQATNTGRHVVTQGSLGDGGVLRRRHGPRRGYLLRGEPELSRDLIRSLRKRLWVTAQQ